MRDDIVRSQYIVPPHYRKQQRLTAKLRRDAAKQEKLSTEARNAFFDDALTPITVKYTDGRPWGTYARHWYAGSRTQ